MPIAAGKSPRHRPIGDDLHVGFDQRREVDEPLSSFLALAASGDDDGRLTAQEISLPEHPVFWAGFALLGEP